MAKLKCFTGNLDGKREGLVIATSQRGAAKIVGTSVHSFSQFWGCEYTASGDYDSMKLYTRPYGSNVPFVEGRCEVQPCK